MNRHEILTPEVVSDMQQHALRDFPNEACGVLTVDGYMPLENIADDKLLAGDIDQNLVENLRDTGKLIGIFHSHCDYPGSRAVFGPSERDMVSQRSMDVPFFLAWTDGEMCSPVAAWGDTLEREPLIGRVFQHGITDCYELIRDYYFLEKGIDLPQFPRNWAWWDSDKNLYEDGFPEAKFRQITAQESRPGDVILFKMYDFRDLSNKDKVQKFNHGGVLYGPGLLLHHVTSKKPYDPARISATTSVGPWLRFDHIWLRYYEND